MTSGLLATALALAGMGATGPGGSEVRLRLAAGGGNPVTVRLHVEAVQGGGSPSVVEATAPGTVRVALGAGELRTVRVEAAGLWAAPAVVAAGTPTTIDIWPASVVRGKVTVPRNEAPPGEVTLRFDPGPRADRRPPGATVPCPLREGAFECTTPAASSLDLRLRARGFVSHYFWARPVPVGGHLDLGTVALRRGGSVVGWVESTGVPLPGNCTLTLTPAAAGRVASAAETERTRRLAGLARPTERGFFAFEELPAGRYTLTARQAGMAPAVVTPIEVIENAETELREPIRLAPPVRLEVLLEPPRDAYGEDWRVEAAHETVPGFREPAAAAPSASGRWLAEGLSPGTYHLKVVNSRGARFAALETALDAASPPVEVRLDLVPLEGRVTLAGEPLWSLVTFAGDMGAVRIPIETDEDGELFGFLPREGPWNIEIASEDPDVERRLQRVEVRRLDGAPTARVDLDLPATALAGEAVEGGGRPVPAARVTVAPSPLVDRPVQAETDEEGRFELLGLEPGDYTAQASAEVDGERLSSALRPVRLDEDAAVEIQLVLGRRKALRGRVVAPEGGGMPAALVTATPLLGASSLALDAEEAVTGADGGFEVELPAEATGVAFDVMAPGLAFHQRAVSPLPAAEVILTPERYGGTLVLEMAEEPAWLDWSRPLPILFHEGSGLGLAANGLVRWAQLNGVAIQEPRRLTFPQMPAGRWTVCLPPSRQVDLDTQARLPPSACRSGVLGALGSLSLQVPDHTNPSLRTR